MIRLNLGAGDRPLDGWTNLDGAQGDTIFPLADIDNSVNEIRASHVLEHFGHAEVIHVLRDWARALKPGGLLRLAVPDLEAIARAYLSGANWPIQGYLMGGQVDERDFHKSAFDEESLSEVMRAAGLVGLHRWQSETQDCAALPVSLNLAGYKRPAAWPSVAAVMSVPRLGFMDNFFSAFEALVPLKIRLRKFSGAFWGQCLTRAIEESLGDHPDYILAIDYDTLYRKQDVEDLLAFAIASGADAVAPIQSSRSKSSALFLMRDGNGAAREQIRADELDPALVPVDTAHFGCTLLRSACFEDLPKPWLWSTPAPDGSWGEGRVDEDIYFWHNWRKAGRTLFLAPRVVVGHAELMVRWPGQDMAPLHQHPSEYHAQGRPDGTWR